MLASVPMDDITLVGIDTGGTFTDIVALQQTPGAAGLRHCKVLSDPSYTAPPLQPTRCWKAKGLALLT